MARRKIKVYSVADITPINGVLLSEVDYLRNTLKEALNQQKENFAMIDRQAQKIDAHEASRLDVTVQANNIRNASTMLHVYANIMLDTLDGIKSDLKTINEARDEFAAKYLELFNKQAQEKSDIV